jgi:hypothetical protein
MFSVIEHKLEKPFTGLVRAPVPPLDAFRMPLGISHRRIESMPLWQ